MREIIFPTNDLALKMLSEEERTLLVSGKVQCRVCGKIHSLNKKSWKACSKNMKLKNIVKKIRDYSITIGPPDIGESIELSSCVFTSLLGHEGHSIKAEALKPELAIALGVDRLVKLRDIVYQRMLEEAEKISEVFEKEVFDIHERIGKAFGIKVPNPRLLGLEVSVGYLIYNILIKDPSRLHVVIEKLNGERGTPQMLLNKKKECIGPCDNIDLVRAAIKNDGYSPKVGYWRPSNKEDVTMYYALDLTDVIGREVLLRSVDVGNVLAHFLKLFIWGGKKGLNKSVETLGYDNKSGVALIRLKHYDRLVKYYLVDLRRRTYEEVNRERANEWLGGVLRMLEEEVRDEIEQVTG